MCVSEARAGWDKPRNARAAASDMQGRTQPCAGGNTGMGLSCPGQGHPETCPLLSTHAAWQWGQDGLGYPSMAGCRECQAPCPAPEPRQAAWFTQPQASRSEVPRAPVAHEDTSPDSSLGGPG